MLRLESKFDLAWPDLIDQMISMVNVEDQYSKK